MNFVRYAPGSINPENLVGKPVTITVGGEKKTIGEVTGAEIRDGHLLVSAKLDLTDA